VGRGGVDTILLTLGCIRSVGTLGTPKLRHRPSKKRSQRALGKKGQVFKSGEKESEKFKIRAM